MRLTLRTLLAYLDDRLSPANAKELGQKIAKSPFATELVDRIRDVKRRRRLAMPEKSVVLIDANLVAEYLDDQLTPELVARVEKEVLASDMMLAEVASAHEILGLLHDPVTIDARLRDRLYALDPTGKADVVQALSGNVPAGVRDAAMNAGEWKPLPTTAPSNRRVPIFILAGLALLWLAVVVSDSHLFGPQTRSAVVGLDGQGADVPNNGEQNIEPDQASVIEENQDAGKVQNGTTPGTGQIAAMEPDATKVADNADDAAAEMAKSGDATASSVSPPPAPSPDAETVVAANEVPRSDAADRPADSVDSRGVPQVARSPFHLMSNNKTFFVFDESTDRWLRVDQIPGCENIAETRNTVDCDALFNHRWFAMPEPFIASFVAEHQGWNAMMSGNTLARISSEAVPGLEVFSGRIKLSVDPSEPWADDRSPEFSLKTAGVTAVVSLRSKDSLIGIEVVPGALTLLNSPPADTKTNPAEVLLNLNGGDFQVIVTVITGDAVIRLSGVDQEAPLSKGQGISWLAPGSAATGRLTTTAENVTPDDGRQIAAIPAWLRENTSAVPEAEALNAQIVDALAKGDDPIQAVIPLLSDRNPQLGVRAVKVLSATRDVDSLLSTLFEPVDESVNRAVIDGLSQIANGSSAGYRSIRRALETRLPMAEIDLTMSLISGIDDAEARDAEFCKALVDLLNNDRLATRTLAFYRIQKYSDDRLGYHPEAESSRRRDAVRRWQKFLERNSGKLIP